MIRVTNLAESWSLEFKAGEHRFPDGTQHLSAMGDGTVDTIYWFYEDDSELFTLIALKHFYDELIRDNEIDLVLPYIPNARMDRVQDPRDVFTLKSFAKVINSLNFYNVVILDPHSNVSTALLDRVICMGVNQFIESAMRRQKSNYVIFYPDAGALKRYGSPCIGNYCGVAYGEKVRNWATGKIEKFTIQGADIVKGKNVLIIDDICSRGGTFYHSAKALKEAGAEDIQLYVTHAEHTMVEGDMYKGDMVSHIYTTNSIFNPEWDYRNKVTTMEVVY